MFKLVCFKFNNLIKKEKTKKIYNLLLLLKINNYFLL